MIILEGPDGSGKTTLADELVRSHGYTRLHQGPPKAGENLFESYKRVLTTFQRTGGRVVCDRLYEGELVYGPVLRGTCRLTEYQVNYLRLLAQDAVKVSCNAPADLLVNRGDPIYDSVDAQELLDRYEQLLPFFDMTYRSDREDPKETAERLAAADHTTSWPFRGVGGHVGPSVVLVGEGWPGRLPPPGADVWDMEPYLSMRPFDGSQSGRFLLGALRDAFGNEEVYLTNARKQWTTRSVTELRKELASLGNQDGFRLVALGHEAFRELCLAGYRSRAVLVDHPQYFRRFHFEKQGEYAEQLRRCL